MARGHRSATMIALASTPLEVPTLPFTPFLSLALVRHRGSFVTLLNAVPSTPSSSTRGGIVPAGVGRRCPLPSLLLPVPTDVRRSLLPTLRDGGDLVNARRAALGRYRDRRSDDDYDCSLRYCIPSPPSCSPPPPTPPHALRCQRHRRVNCIYNRYR